MQQRYYDSGIGRFLSVDPVTAYSSPVAMFNRYRYAGSNPYKYIDPDGQAHQVHWVDDHNVTVTIPFVISDPYGVAKFTDAQVSAGISQRLSGSTVIDGVNVTVTAVGVSVKMSPESYVDPQVNLIQVDPKTEISTANAIGGNKIDLRGSAGPDVVVHELGHTAGAGDQRVGGVDVSGKIIEVFTGPTNNLMGINTGNANAQTLREIVTAPTAARTCSAGVSNGSCP